MQFKVPKIKHSSFSTEFFNLLSDSIFELRHECGKLPDRVTFSGPLGKELHAFILEKGWDLKQFGLQSAESLVDKIIFDYSKPIDQIEDRGATIFDESFNNRKINGIPGPETIQKILGAYSSPAFKIERQVRPKLEIKLTR
jgi:hypothetical protein